LYSIAENIDAGDFIPAMPPRLPDNTPFLIRLFKNRNNLVAGWTEECFESPLFAFKLLKQRYIVCNDASHVKHVFLDSHDNYDPKSPQMRRALKPLLGDGLFASDGDLWRARRAACAPALRTELLPHFTPIMVETAQEMADRWSGLENPRVDVLSEMAQLTARIIGRTIFGDNTSIREAEQVVRGFSRYQRSIEQMDLASTLNVPALKWLRNPLQKYRGLQAAGEVHTVIDRIIASHRNDPKRQLTNNNLLSLFLNTNTADDTTGSDGSCPFDDVAVRNEAIVMFMAGHETTANTLAWAWYLIAACPNYRDLLTDELDQVLGERLPDLNDVGNLPVTRAIIEETMRLYPPVPVLSRQARADDKLDTKTVRAGDIMLVVPWLLHRHNKHWDKPNAFRPERFYPDAKRPNRFIYIPFSVGHRVCLGQRFGLTEAILCFAILAQRFRLDLMPGQPVNVSCRLTLRPDRGLPMIIAPRE